MKWDLSSTRKDLDVQTWGMSEHEKKERERTSRLRGCDSPKQRLYKKIRGNKFELR